MPPPTPTHNPPNKVVLPLFIPLLLAFTIASTLTSVFLTLNGRSRRESKDWVLVGGVTSHSATFRVRTDARSSRARRIAVWEGGGGAAVVPDGVGVGAAPPPIAVVELTRSDPVETVDVSGLRSDSYHRYSTFDGGGGGGSSAVTSGSFRTPPPDGAEFDFKMAASGCALTGSRSRAFSRVAEERPLLFVHLGDFHYEDINSTNVEDRIRAVDRVMGSAEQSALYGSTALAYMWDDHDYLGNDSGGGGDGKERAAALESYRVAFPFYGPLPAASGGGGGGGEVSPYHAFTIGTVRFVISDLRSESTSESIYSPRQRDWLRAELSNASSYDFVVWVTTKPWIGTVDLGDDAWWGHPSDRADLSDFIARSVGGTDGPGNLIALSSDAHMVGYDDGRNTYYGAGAGAGAEEGAEEGGGSHESFPILQSGPLDKLGSAKGGPYSDGCSSIKLERNGQYSTLEFQTRRDVWEDGPCVRIASHRVGGGGGSTELISSRRICGRTFASADGAGTGSCDIRLVSPASIGMFSAAAAMGLCCTIVACRTFDRRESAEISGVVLLSLLIPMIAGIGTPFAMGVEMYDLPYICLITLLLLASMSVLLFCRVRGVRGEGGGGAGDGEPLASEEAGAGEADAATEGAGAGVLRLRAEAAL